MSQCPQCGAHVGADRPFCGNCGATLAPAPAAPAQGNEDVTRIHQQQPSDQPAGQPWTPQAPQGQAPQGQAPQSQPPYGAPQGQPEQPQYGGPQAPQGQPAYGAPQAPQPGYGAPQAPQGHPDQPQYGAPQQPGYGAPQGGPAYGAPQGQPQGGPAYGAPQGQFGAPNKSQFDFSRLLAGNWGGSAMVAGAALVVALIGGALFSFTTMGEFDFAQALGMTLILAVSAFGSNVIGDFSSNDVSVTQNLGQYPLLVTVLALGVAVWLFRRVTANYRNVLDALFDAVRTALILMVGVLVLAIVVRIWSPDTTGFQKGGDGGISGVALGPSGLGLVGAEKSFNSIAGAIFITFLLALTVLAIAVFVRRDWLPAKAQQIHDWLVVPMFGIAAVAAAATVAGLLYLIAIIIGNDDARGFSEIMRLVAILPALGLRFVSLGVFANTGTVAKGDGNKQESLDRLPDFADDNGALFWIAPLIALAVMAAGVYAIIWKSLDKSKILRHTLVYLGLLIVAVPFMVRFSNAHAGGKQEYDGDKSKFSAWVGMDAFQTTAFFFLFSILVAAVLLLVTGNLDVNALKSRAQGMANQVKGQQPGGQQAQQQGWQGQQPGGQQGWQQQPGQAPQQWGQPGPQQQQGWQQQPPQQGGQQPPQQWGQPDPQGGQQQPPAPPQQQGWQQQPPQQGGQQPPQQ